MNANFLFISPKYDLTDKLQLHLYVSKNLKNPCILLSVYRFVF
jgi:hypothetical protein